jgi:hypothetical protein
MDAMSSSDSDAQHHQQELDPVIADAVDGVTNRFGAEGLEQMIAYAESSLAEARKALQELGDPAD